MAMAAAPAADAVAGRVAAKQASKAAAKDAAAKTAPAGGGGGAGGGKGTPGGGKGKDPGGGKESGGGGGKSGGAKAQSSGKSRSKRAVSWAWSGNKKLLMAQFVLCVVILALGSLTSDPQDGKSAAGRAMVKGSAFALIFFLLAILSAGGKGAAKSATAVGTLITVSYALTSSDVHAVVTWINSFFKGAAKKFPAPASAQEKAEQKVDETTQTHFPGTSS
jgi:hypothetical protein